MSVGWCHRRSGRRDDGRPESPLGKAIGYATKQWSTLLHAHGDPTLDIDNNEAERRLQWPGGLWERVGAG